MATLRQILFALIAVTVVATADDDPFAATTRPQLEKYCFSCHGLEKTKGKLNLVQFEEAAQLGLHDRTWLKVIEQLEIGDMPPEDEPQPTEAERAALVKQLRDLLAKFDYANLPPDPGHVPPHRLNRSEYANTVRDLLGVSIEVEHLLPADGGGGEGFDNAADTLFLSPLLLESYLDAAAQVVNAALETPVDKRPSYLRPHPEAAVEQQLKQILSATGTLAFRRPLTPGEIDPLIKIANTSLADSQDLRGALRPALIAILVSPKFLFRTIPTTPDQGTRPLTDHELASRLSYFLWSSMPDAELRQLAADGKLHQPDTLAAQTRRLLHHPKADAFFERFTSQWLKFDSLYSTTWPDKHVFPEYNSRLRDKLYREPILMFAHLVKNNLPATDLVAADYTFVDHDLAKHYGLPNVDGKHFRKVTSPDARRGGILGMGAIMAATSFPRRTSPVLRGKWVLDELLGAEIPPPPPNVGDLPEDDRPRNGLTFRQRLEQHRNKPECASCHDKIDPIGYALEFYSVTGKWRQESHGTAIDGSGKLPTGETFAGPGELKKILAGRRDAFARNLVERLLGYSLGRGIEPHDTPVVRTLLAELGPKKYRLEDVIVATVQSYPFRHQRPPSPETTAQ